MLWKLKEYHIFVEIQNKLHRKYSCTITANGFHKWSRCPWTCLRVQCTATMWKETGANWEFQPFMLTEKKQMLAIFHDKNNFLSPPLRHKWKHPHVVPLIIFLFFWVSESCSHSGQLKPFNSYSKNWRPDERLARDATWVWVRSAKTRVWCWIV